MEYDAIVIGAGVAGLASALSLSAQGKKVLVIEKQPVPGGVATSFRRKGFQFESSLHFVDALACGGEVREFLDEQGVSSKVEFIGLKEFGRVIYPEHDFIIENSLDRLEEGLKNDFPDEAAGICRLFKDINRFCAEFDGFTDSKLPIAINLLLSPLFYRSIIKTSCLTLEQFIGSRVKDEKLRAILGTLWGFIGLPPREVSAFYYLIVMRGCWGNETAYVKGGFNKLFEAATEIIRERGSQVIFNTSVKKILTANGKQVKGIVTQTGEEFAAKAVVSNANSIDTLSKLIDCDSLREMYAKKMSLMQKSISALTLYLGLDVLAKDVGMDYPVLSINCSYDQSMAFKNCLLSDYKNCGFAVVDHSQLDPGLAPVGKSTLCVMTLDNYANWEGINDEEYDRKKKEAGKIILAQLEKYLPGLSRHIEVLEIATPKTMARFATLPQGAIYGFAQTVGQAAINRIEQRTKIRGLFLCGGWTQPGAGVHGCFVSGIEAAGLALKYLK